MNVFTKNYSHPETDKREIMRYAGIRQPDPETDALLDSCLEEALRHISYKLCYTRLPVKNLPEKFRELEILKDCDEAIMFASTLGIEYDRLISRYGVSSPARALMLQAIGAERIESLCDLFCAEFENATRRFSPGFGGLGFDAQLDIFKILDPAAHIGLSISEKLIMTPSKSVTAIFGLRK